MIITISRETGSGGHTIGQMLAKRLGYDFYDKEIVADVAGQMHLDEEMILENDEYMSDQTFIDMASGFIPFSRKSRIPFDEIKAKQDQLIQKIAAKGNSVIVGRGADYVLKDFPDTFHVFIHANMAHRIARVQRHEGIGDQEARIRRELKVKDHSRGLFYQYFTGQTWGTVQNYHLSIDTSIFSKTQATALIVDAIEKSKRGEKHA